MRNKTILLIIVCAAFRITCFAQTGKFEEELLTSQQLASERYILNNSVHGNLPANGANLADINQQGDGNTVIGKQDNTGNGRNPNLMIIMQSGNLNNISLNQTGESNKTDINQLGNGNDYEGKITGNNNSATINQFGNRNSVNQELTGDGMNYRLIQQGNNNQINQFENGVQNNGYEVVQQGSDMQITITNGF